MGKKDEMLSQKDFRTTVGVSFKKLKLLQEQGEFLPVLVAPVSNREFYSKEQVEEFNEKYNKGMTANEFADRIGKSTQTVNHWEVTGFLVPEYRNVYGFARYSEEQVEKYFAGFYDKTREEGFYNRKQIAELFGVSMAKVRDIYEEGLFVLDHKGFRNTHFYKKEEVDKVFHNKKLWFTDALGYRYMKKVQSLSDGEK